MPKVSVIVPVYNSEKFLAKTIESVLRQTFSDFELLLVDDGSKDSSPSICDSYAANDNRVRVFHKPNGGVSSARNCGLDNANGEFVAFLDNDDLYYPEFLQTMVGNIADFDYLLASFIECDKIDSKDIVSRKTEVLEHIDAHNHLEVQAKADAIHFSNFGIVWCTLFRKSIIDKHCIRFKETQHEDTIFLYDYVSHCDSMRSIPYEGIFRYYRADSQGHSHNYIAEMPAIANIDNAFHAAISHFGLTEQWLFDDFRERLRTFIRTFLLKGYYRDTRVSYGKRMKRWGEARNYAFKIPPYTGRLSRVDKAFNIISKSRLYFILDPIILLLVSVLSARR